MSTSGTQRGPHATKSRWATLGRTVGSAVGAVRRLLVLERRPAAMGKQGALSRLVGMRRRLVSEVAELEAELQELHTTITNNPFPRSGEAGRSNLESLIRRARRLRQQARDKRDTVARIERHIARERWLASADRVARTQREPRKPPRTPRARARKSGKVQAILARSALQSRSQRAELRRLGADLSSPSLETRHAACQKLGEFRVVPARKLLVAALDDRSERVQLAALNALAGARGRGALQAFRRFVGHDNPALRLAALRGLAGAAPGSVTRAELTRALSDDEPAVRRFALKVLAWRRDGEAQDPEALPQLALALHDDDIAVRLGAVEALAASGSQRSVAALIRAVADEAEKVRDAASTAIVDIVGPEANGVGAGLPPAERAAALKQWWATARVDLALSRSAGADGIAPPPAPEVPLSAPEVPLSAPEVPLSAPEVPLSAPEVPLSAPEPLRRTVPSPGAPSGATGAPVQSAPPPREPHPEQAGAAVERSIAEAAIAEELVGEVAITEVESAGSSADAAADLDALSQQAALESAESSADVASAADLDALSEQADFESVFGEESTAASGATLEPEEGFESVFGEDAAEEGAADEQEKTAQDESAEAEEYENVFGTEED